MPTSDSFQFVGEPNPVTTSSTSSTTASQLTIPTGTKANFVIDPPVPIGEDVTVVWTIENSDGAAFRELRLIRTGDANSHPELFATTQNYTSLYLKGDSVIETLSSKYHLRAERCAHNFCIRIEQMLIVSKMQQQYAALMPL